MTSFNMPPGVSVSDIPGWDCPDEKPMHHCQYCGAFISDHPTREVITTTREYCDGKIHESIEEYEESTWNIIKDSTIDRTYVVKWVQCKGQWDDQPLEEHKPHYFDFFGDTQWQVRCRKCCRYTTIDAEGYPLCDFA